LKTNHPATLLVDIFDEWIGKKKWAWEMEN
jgi:hypothetical protein